MRRGSARPTSSGYAPTPLLETRARARPLETLDGRDHYDFPPAEEPPWRWKVESVYPG